MVLRLVIPLYFTVYTDTGDLEKLSSNLKINRNVDIRFKRYVD